MIEICMTVDEVLAQVGYKPYRTETIGKDENGKIVCWYYMRYNLLFKRSEVDGIMAYRVTQIEHKPQRIHGTP